MSTEAGVYKPTAERVARALLDANAVSVAADLETRTSWPSWRGWRTPVAIGLERVSADPGAAATIVASLASGITTAFPEVEAIIGVGESGLYWSAVAARELAIPHGFIRKTRSRSGRSQPIEACFPSGAKLLLIDDVAATGATFESCTKVLRVQLQATVLGCQVVLRVPMRECRERETRLGVPLRSLVTTDHLLRETVRRMLLGTRAAREVQRFYAAPDAHDWDLAELTAGTGAASGEAGPGSRAASSSRGTEH